MNKRLQTLMGIALAALLSACGGPSGSGAKPGPASAEQVARGRYLARAADCASCHTAQDGAPMAGGVPLASSFGKFYGSNITPDPDHGIGRWSADDFYKALHDGTAPGGRQLYPAMPYTSYRMLTRQDVDDIYAYLMQLPPVNVASRAPELEFPYNLRFGVFFWKLLFLKDERPAVSVGQSPQWARGRYLSEGLGHCAECHTPRGKLGQLDNAQALKGGVLGHWLAPDITPEALAARGWTSDDLGTYMRTGLARQGSAWGEMHTVVDVSTRYLTPEDNTALVRYMTGDKPPAPVPATEDPSADSKLVGGYRHYMALCAGCHATEGQGQPFVVVPMAGNATLRQADPRNLVMSVLLGIDTQTFPGGLNRMDAMPGFAKELDDVAVAELANYLRMRFGGQPASVTAEAVAALRAQGGR